MTSRCDAFLLLDEPDKELIWSLVDARSKDECWLWKGVMTTRDNRGTIKLYGHVYVAARLVLALKTGFYPDVDIKACHSCDNPPCCNPRHLWWGTHYDNVADAVAKGRMYKWNGERAGESNPRAKLVASDIPNIRSDTRMIGVIAAEYGVGRTAISDIKHHKTWINT